VGSYRPLGVTDSCLLIHRRQVRRARLRLIEDQIVYLPPLVSHARREAGLAARIKQLSFDWWGK
jgi:hypothetical protein